MKDVLTTSGGNDFLCCWNSPVLTSLLWT